MQIKRRISLTLLPVIMILGLFTLITPTSAEVIEKIYAAVNGELITYTDLKKAEDELTKVLSQEYKGEELAKQIEDMKKNLLDRMIDDKMLLSFAKEKNYSVDGDVELTIKEFKKQNNLNTDEELRQAMAEQGLNMDEWKAKFKESRMQQYYIREMIGSKIKIDNSAIMEYYKKNITKYTLPMKITLNCIYLDKANYKTPDSLENKKNTVTTELKTSKFEDVAKKYTDLPGGEIHLGEFKQGEIDPTLEKSAVTLKKDEYSNWIDTPKGWYIIQLVNKSESELVEYKKVRDEIEETLRSQEEGGKIKDFIQGLRKESHIKIYEKW